MNKDQKKILNIFSRYLAIIILGLGNLKIIYEILTPLTVQTTSFILKILAGAYSVQNIIHLQQSTIQIVPACTASSAFYLLIALLLSIPDIKPITRTKAIFTAIAALFFLNISRIVALSFLTSYPNFETLHWIFWHVISTILVVLVYIATIKIYEIKKIPLISDFKYLQSLKK